MEIMNSLKDNQSCKDAKDNKTKKPTVVVTGFGPFAKFDVKFDVNPSWVVVQELKNLVKSSDEFNLVIKQVAVDYSVVNEIVPKLWKENSPELMVHCGVSSQATSLVLESRAFNTSYLSPDICGNLPPENCCQKCGDNCIVSGINMDLVSEEVNNAELGVIAAVSKDAGRYLCEFTYYSSLNINPMATAFIHVPPLNAPYSSQQMAKGVLVAIKAMLKQIN